MDDKKFDEIMKKYVSRKSRPEDVDFEKLNEREYKNVQPRFSRRMAISFMSCFILIAVTLAIVLPLTLRVKNDTDPINPTPDDGGFCYSGEYKLIAVADYERLSSDYDIKPKLIPTVSNYKGMGIFAMQPIDDNRLLGAYISYGVYGDYLREVDIRIIPKNVVLGYYTHYEDCSDNVTWKNLTVKYYIVPDSYEKDGDYEARLYIFDGSYKYYVTVKYFEELEIKELLDMIF